MTDQPDPRHQLVALVQQMGSLQLARATIVAASDGLSLAELLAVTEALDAVVQRLDKLAIAAEAAANLDERMFRVVTGSKPSPRL